jgi:phosphatidylglycerol:prolipoprotein diacylglycerol transferase
MSLYNFIIWNGSPTIIDTGVVPLRWYGLLFASGFLFSQQILYYIFKKEGKPKADVDTLTIYMVIATLIGARLGHILFYQVETIWQDPLSIILPFRFNPEFEFTGFQGLASHGAAIGILFALYLYSRKKKPGQNYLQIVDRIVIVVALTGALIRLGNFFNSEIIGLQTNSQYGIVFARHITDVLAASNIEDVSYARTGEASNTNGYPQLAIDVTLPNDVQDREGFINKELIPELKYGKYVSDHVDQTAPITYTLHGDHATILAYVIPRYPAQLFESISSLLLCIALFIIWNKNKQYTKPGLLLGIFLVVCFGLRFLYEFLKVNQEDFENNLPINMGQILSIPLIIAGIVLLLRTSRKEPVEATSELVENK